MTNRATSLYSIKDEINNTNENENQNEEEEEEEEENVDYFEFLLRSFSTIFKFLLNYFLTIYLLVLAESENSQIISLLFLVIALVSFSKVKKNFIELNIFVYFSY